MLILPSWTPFNVFLYSSFMLMLLFVVYADYYDKWGALQYSKFSTGGGLPSRQAMFILYFLPIVTVTLSAWSYLSTANALQWIVYGAVMLHFIKRVLETLFLHKYSGTFGIQTLALVTWFYSFSSAAIGYLNRQPIPAEDAWFYAGILLFILGEAGNFYHHKLLAGLRTEGAGYHIPRGGLFEYVACPHYLFELIAWLGILWMSRHLFALLNLLAMTAYLTERSVKTDRWYREKFTDYPAERKRILPFVF